MRIDSQERFVHSNPLLIVILFLYLVNVSTKERESVDYYAIIMIFSSLLLFHVGDIKAVFKTECEVHMKKPYGFDFIGNVGKGQTNFWA